MVEIPDNLNFEGKGTVSAQRDMASTYEKNKLRIAGFLNGVGDVSLFWGAYHAKKHLKTAAGALYSLGAATVAFFGTPRRDEQVQDLTERAAEFVQQNSAVKSTELQASQIIQNKETGFFTNAGKYLRRHAAQIMLYFYTAGAGFMLANGIKDFRDDRAGKDKSKYSIHDYSGIALGGFSLAVKLAALAMPEKAEKNLESGEAAPTKSFWQDVKEKPLKLFGYGSMLTEAFWGWETYKNKKNNKPWKWDAVTGASYAASDLVIATTHKDAANAVEKLSAAEQNKLEDMIAETIAVQEQSRQEKLIAQNAGFLNKEALVAKTQEQLAESLREKVKMRSEEKNWASRAATDAQVNQEYASVVKL